jgi:hypothetical protein
MKRIVYDGRMGHAGVAFVLRCRGAALKFTHVFTTSNRTSELPPESHVPKSSVDVPKVRLIRIGKRVYDPHKSVSSLRMPASKF